jgi:hypothetical protein
MTELRIDDTELLTWFERDRAHVELRNKLDDSTIVEWWDGDVAEAVEDGSLSPRDYHSTAYEYADVCGLLPEVEEA